MKYSSNRLYISLLSPFWKQNSGIIVFQMVFNTLLHRLYIPGPDTPISSSPNEGHIEILYTILSRNFTSKGNLERNMWHIDCIFLFEINFWNKISTHFRIFNFFMWWEKHLWGYSHIIMYNQVHI